MNRFLLLFITTLLLASCGGNAPKSDKQATITPEANPTPDIPLEQQLANKIGDEMRNGERNDTIILGHTFGMSRKDVYNYKNKLVRKKKVYGVYKTKNTRVFVYDLKLPKAGKVRVYFDTFYHENELYRFECLPKIPKKSSPEKILEEMVDLFTKKYGPADFILPVENVASCNRHIWIKGNQQIEITCDEKETMLSYTDSIREALTLADI